MLVRLHRHEHLRASPRYGLIERLLLEQYHMEGTGEERRITLKAARAIRADSLQSPP